MSGCGTLYRGSVAAENITVVRECRFDAHRAPQQSNQPMQPKTRRSTQASPCYSRLRGLRQLEHRRCVAIARIARSLHARESSAAVDRVYKHRSLLKQVAD